MRRLRRLWWRILDRVQPITVSCNDVIGFVDGELKPRHANRFRGHLRVCASCRSELPGTLQLSARLSALKENR